MPCSNKPTLEDGPSKKARGREQSQGYFSMEDLQAALVPLIQSLQGIEGRPGTVETYLTGQLAARLDGYDQNVGSPPGGKE